MASSTTRPRVWFDKPCLYWYGWKTLLPWVWGNDEWHRRDIMLGWTITGRVTFALWGFNRAKCDCPPPCPECSRQPDYAVDDDWYCVVHDPPYLVAHGRFADG